MDLSIFKKFNLQKEVKKIIDKSLEEHYRVECLPCENLKKGCNINDLESIWLILDEIKTYYPNELFSYTRKVLLNENICYLECCKISGKSMYPTLDEDNIIIVGGVRNVDLGDLIISYANLEGKSSIIIHRCVGIDGDFIYLKGDNNTNIEKIKIESVIGKVFKILKKDDVFYDTLDRIFHEKVERDKA